MKVAGGQARPAGEPHPPVSFPPYYRVPEGRMNRHHSHPPPGAVNLLRPFPVGALTLPTGYRRSRLRRVLDTSFGTAHRREDRLLGRNGHESHFQKINEVTAQSRLGLEDRPLPATRQFDAPKLRRAIGIP